jgi:hypothetical protein
MGKIIASYLLKVHLHETPKVEEARTLAQSLDENAVFTITPPTNDALRDAAVAALSVAFGAPVTVSLIERTDSE